MAGVGSIGEGGVGTKETGLCRGSIASSSAKDLLALCKRIWHISFTQSRW